jgi:hypothetical protein
MTASSSESAEPKKKNSTQWHPGIWTLLAIFMVAFGAYYFIRIQQKTAYYAARNLRILSTVTAQVQDRIRTPDGTGEQGELYWDTGAKQFVGGNRPLELNDIVKPVFRQSFVHVFDSVMVLDSHGVVRFQDPPGICNAASFDDLTEVRDLGKEVKLKNVDLQRRAQIARVILDGREYRMFSQPMSVRVGPPAGLVPNGHSAEAQWVVVGVVSSGRFTGESMAISYTLLIAVMAVFLLLLFSVPFLKISLLGPMQRVRFGDILLLGISLLCATAVVTIILFDTLAYRRTRAFADAQLRHLASDIKRHLSSEILHADQVLTMLERTPKNNGVNPLPDEYRKDAVATYPFFESFARIGTDGVQRQKWQMDKRVLPVADVKTRTYFTDALTNQGWTKSGQTGRYTIEGIRSKTTGETQAVIARSIANPTADNAVVAVSFPMLSLINTVIAGSCQFVVIDDSGKVIFHSESQRNNAENFFDESDMSKALRSAVAGRQNEMLNLRYWGEDRRAFATPIDGTPWTLVTFRSKRLLRTLNVETIMITVTFLLLYALAYLIVGGMIAISVPTYRAPWLWPDRRRAHVYLRLIGSYAAFALCFGLSIYLFRPRVLLVLAATIPAMAILLTYLRLARGRLMSWVAAAGVVAALAVSFAYIVNGRIETDVMLLPEPTQFFLLVVGAVAVLLPILPKTDREAEAEKTAAEARDGQPPPMPTVRYVTAAVGLLVLLAVLPTAALYKAAYKIEIESFVKHGQLKLVQDIEARLQHLAAVQTEGWRTQEEYDKRKTETLGVYADFFFQTELLRLTSRSALEKELGRKLDSDDDFLERLTRGRLKPEQDRNPVPRVIEWLLPQYSDYSIRMRELLHSESGDKRWTWRRDGGWLTFASESIYGHDMVARSVVPRLVPRVFGEAPRAVMDLLPLIDPDHPARGDVIWPPDPTSLIGRRVLMMAAVIAYLGFILLAVWFICRKVFLLDVRDPLWLDPKFRLSPALGGNMLIFCPDVQTGLDRVDRRQCFEVQFAHFDTAERDEVWNAVFTEIDRQPPAKGILVPDFDHRLTGTDGLELKLRFLERAMDVHGRKVVAITTTSPWVLLDSMSKYDKLSARWEALLRKFNVRLEDAPKPPTVYPKRAPFAFHLDRRKLMEALRSVPGRLKSRLDRRKLMEALRNVPRRLTRPVTETAAWIHRETRGPDPYLRAVGAQLSTLDIGGREEAYDELLERAGSHYMMLWSSCSIEEKLVLSNLAADGFLNERDRHTIRRLIARNLVCRDPNLRVMNETFRRFVLSDPCRLDLAASDTQFRASTWDRIQRPLVVSLLMASGFFFLTQRELFDASFAIVTAIAGGIPAVLRVVGYFSEGPGIAPSAR